MSKEMNELRKLTDEKLIIKRKDLTWTLMGAHRGVKPLTAVTNRGKIRRSIARIDTLLGERKRRGFTKEQFGVGK